MKNILILLIGIFSFVCVHSQTKDSVLINSEFKFEEGLYLDFSSVKYLSPIRTNSIITNIPITDVEFFSSLTSQEFIEYYDKEGIRQKITTKNVWGYSNNGTLYKNSGSGFFRIPIVASLSQYIAQVIVIRESMGDPYMNSYYMGGMGSVAYESKEPHNFIISFELGSVYDYNYKNLEILLSQDEELFIEYTSLKKRDKKKQIFLYIRKYNEKHPLYLYKSE